MDGCRASLILVLLWPLLMQPAERWVPQPVPEQRGARFVIHDFKMASSCGVAVGCLARGSACAPAALVSSDGGRRWKFAGTEEVGLSLFFLAGGAGWMTTATSLWRTADCGLTWEKLPASDATRGASRVFFLDERSGWAVGPRQGVFRSSDGGVTWEPVNAAPGVKTNPEHTSYDWITFVGGRFGMIAGASIPRQAVEEGQGRELPHLTIFLDTRDGGATWIPSTTSMFGRVTRVAFEADGRGMGLIEFRPGFEFPSEVFAIDWKTGQSRRAFRRSDVAVTDVGFDAQGNAWLAGIHRSRGRTTGRVRAFHSRDLSDWTEAPAGGRNTAARAILATCCGEALWMATDSGALLRLSRD